MAKYVKEKHKSTLNSVISVKGLLQISISQEEYSIPCLVHGHMLSGAWTLWGHFLGLWEIEDGSWLELITSQSGWRSSHYLISGM